LKTDFSTVDMRMLKTEFYSLTAYGAFYSSALNEVKFVFNGLEASGD
jgi:hypothetical protein